MNHDLNLDRFRHYLSLLARLHMGDRFGARLDASDVVQQTLMEAHKHHGDYHGENEAQMAGWLRQILAHTLANAWRTESRDKRDLNRERSLQAALDASSVRLHDFLAADQSSPSRRIQRREHAVVVADALARLPDDQREAVFLRHCEGCSIEQIAQTMNRTEKSASGLIQRGLKQLRQHIHELQ